MGNDRCLDRYDEILLVSRVLQDNSEGVVDLAVHSAVRAQETRHRGRTAEQVQRLVDRVGA